MYNVDGAVLDHGHGGGGRVLRDNFMWWHNANPDFDAVVFRAFVEFGNNPANFRRQFLGTQLRL